MAEVKLEQRMPEKRVNGTFRAGMTTGFLLRGEVDRQCSEIQDHLRLREMVETGAYKRLAESSAIADDSEPLQAFFKLVGTSRDTYDRREKALKILGVENLTQMRMIGVSWKGISILADAPDGMKREMKALTDNRSITKEAIDALIERAIEEAEAKKAANIRAEKAERAQATAEEKRAKIADKLVEKDEKIKDLEAELKIEREGAAMTDREVADRIKQATEHFQLGVRALTLMEKRWKENPEIAGLTNRAILLALGPLERLKVECLKAMGFGQEGR